MVNNFPRKILLAVTGLSPQIITETLYALALSSENKFIPTEIHIITTNDGAKLAKTSLLHPDGGQFYAMLKDYPQLGNPQFNEDNIHIIKNKNISLSDIRTPEDNAATADTITALMAKLTSDNNCTIHVSIAGGRKTMGFYLAYAFSLFARPQDKLSHVLVSAPFENHPEFFFPPLSPKRLTSQEGNHIDTADAIVTLAEIPVVHLRHGLPKELSQGKATYINTVNSLQDSFALPELFINRKEQLVRCGKKVIPLPPALIAWFALWAEKAIIGKAFCSWREINHKEYLQQYAYVLGNNNNGFYERAKTRLINGMEEGFFQENNSKLNRVLKNVLGIAENPYLIIPSGTRGKTKRGLTLSAEAIKVI